MTTEDLLVICDALEEELGCTVRSYAALSAIAAACQPRIGGCAVYRTGLDQTREVQDIIARLEPLTCHNELFTRIVLRVLTQRSHH